MSCDQIHLVEGIDQPEHPKLKVKLTSSFKENILKKTFGFIIIPSLPLCQLELGIDRGGDQWTVGIPVFSNSSS